MTREEQAPGNGVYELKRHIIHGSHQEETLRITAPWM